MQSIYIYFLCYNLYAGLTCEIIVDGRPTIATESYYWSWSIVIKNILLLWSKNDSYHNNTGQQYLQMGILLMASHENDSMNKDEHERV